MSTKRQPHWGGEYQNEGTIAHREYIESKLRNLRKVSEELNGVYLARWGTDNKIKIPLKEPLFYGLQYCYVAKASLTEKIPGLKEAVDACTMKPLFSGWEPRKCNCKNFNLGAGTPISHDDFFDEHNWFIPSRLRLVSISEKEWLKLSAEAQAWFRKRFYMLDWKGDRVYDYEPHIPFNFLTRVCNKIYVINRVVDDCNKRSRLAEIYRDTRQEHDLYWFWGQEHPDSRWTKFDRKCQHKINRKKAKAECRAAVKEYYDTWVAEAEESE